MPAKTEPTVNYCKECAAYFPIGDTYEGHCRLFPPRAISSYASEYIVVKASCQACLKAVSTKVARTTKKGV